jgi:hypothetical protein
MSTRKLRQGYRHPGGASWADQGWRTARLDRDGDLASMWRYSDTLADHRADLMTETEPDGTVLAVERVNQARTGWERTGTLTKLKGKVVYRRASTSTPTSIPTSTS